MTGPNIGLLGAGEFPGDLVSPLKLSLFRNPRFVSKLSLYLSSLKIDFTLSAILVHFRLPSDMNRCCASRHASADLGQQASNQPARASDRNRPNTIMLRCPTKVLNAAEGAHIKNMSTFETNEHLRDMQVVFTSNQQAFAKPTRVVRTRSRRYSCALTRGAASLRTRDVAGLRAGRDRPGSARGERK
jgi:hypothetical protein